MIAVLMNNGSEPNMADTAGKTVLDLARTPSVGRIIQELDNSELKRELRGLGVEHVGELQELLHESFLKCFWNRVYLVGPYSVGKSCLAKILVGEKVPIIRQSTEGIWIYMGRAGMDVEKKEWVYFPKGNAITEILTNMLISISIGEAKVSVREEIVKNILFDETTLSDSPVLSAIPENRQGMTSLVEKYEGNQSKNEGNNFTTSTEKKKPISETDKYNMKKVETNETTRLHEEEKLDNNPSDCKALSTCENEEFKTSKIKRPSKTSTNHADSEWVENISSNMSQRQIHRLIVKAVEEGKYKQKVVPIDIWDFGGQKDYYMTHQLFITSRGIFVLMFNGSIDLHKHIPDLGFLPGHFGKPTVSVYLIHWVNSILTYCKRTDKGFPRIIFVATHKDEKWFEWTRESRRNELELKLHKLFESHAGLKHLEIKPLIFVDATNPEDPEITDLRKRLMQRATEHPRWGEAMPTRWIPLELQLAQKSEEGTNIISRNQLRVLNSRNKSMVLSETQIETFLKVQHSLGKLLYFDVENLRDFIIISPAYLVEVLRSIVTEKQFWPKGERFSNILKNLQEYGMIEREDIYYLWEQETFKHILPYKEYILQMLLHLDVILAPRNSYRDVDSPFEDVSRFLIPCMITKGNDTMFLKTRWLSNNSIILSYTFIEEVIPPALSYRFLSSFITSWDIKTYNERGTEKKMLFNDLAVLEVDSCHDIAVQVKTNRIIVSLVHANKKEDIIPILASSIQECLTAAIVRISEFYSRLSEDVEVSASNNSVLPFKIEFGVFCKSEICFFKHNEISSSTGEPTWICKTHNQRHMTKSINAWFSEKAKNELEELCDVCTSSCKGLGKLEREQCPLPQHIRRLAALLSLVECREIAMLLGFQVEEWNDLEYQFQHQPPNDLKFMALWSCIIKKKSFSFGGLISLLEKKGRAAHLLCQVFRDVQIDVSDMSEDTLNKIPSFNALNDLANHIGDSIMQLAIELDIDISFLQQIQHDFKNKLLEQTRRLFFKWRTNKFPKPTVLRLLKALYRVGKFGPTFKILQGHC
ncbi:uncharacterized protein LOC143042893 [Mytilus galloprovincialis]|uniref:uncharacterized protein LOC143042893 n=1 Tax=Mytilus galloprovincialis TaxID=29158 RepID=UPI003F7BFD21